MDASRASAWDLLFVRDLEKGKMIQTVTRLDIYDGRTTKLVLQCRELDANLLSKGAQFYGGEVAKTGPFNIRLCLPNTDSQVLRIAREPAAFKVYNICIFDEKNNKIAELREPFFALTKTYRTTDDKGQSSHLLQLNPGLNIFRIAVDRTQIATVHLTWNGENADFFKAGCVAAIEFDQKVQHDTVVRQIALGVALCVKKLE